MNNRTDASQRKYKIKKNEQQQDQMHLRENIKLKMNTKQMHLRENMKKMNNRTDAS